MTKAQPVRTTQINPTLGTNLMRLPSHRASNSPGKPRRLHLGVMHRTCRLSILLPGRRILPPPTTKAYDEALFPGASGVCRAGTCSPPALVAEVGGQVKVHSGLPDLYGFIRIRQ